MDNTKTTTNFTLYAFGSVLFLLSLSVVKISIVQIGQIALLLFFIGILLDEYRQKSVRWGILWYMVGFGLLLSLISFASPEQKIGEYKFVIKYLFIFPPAYYIGVWAGEKLSLKNLISVLEVNIVLFMGFALLLWIYPVGFLVHDRGMHEFKGTFFESGGFAVILGNFLLTVVLLKLDMFKSFSKKDIALYVIALFALIWSHNKSVWLGFVSIVFMFILLKPFIHDIPNRVHSSELYSKLHIKKMIFLLLFLVIGFFIVNSLLEEPIVSIEMIKNKMQNERGKVVLVVLHLLEQSNWQGAYGFGFVERFFSTYTDAIVGLGGQVGMIFNSYLDVWISVGFLGVIYHLSLLWNAWDRRSLVTMALPMYWFVMLNTNPTSQSEYYFIFLGLCYGYIRNLNMRKEN